MKQKGAANLYNSIEKVFRVASSLEEFLKEKACLQTKLNTQLVIIKDRIISKMPGVIKNLRNRKFETSFTFKSELDLCKEMLKQIEDLDDKIKSHYII